MCGGSRIFMFWVSVKMTDGIQVCTVYIYIMSTCVLGKEYGVNYCPPSKANRQLMKHFWSVCVKC